MGCCGAMPCAVLLQRCPCAPLQAVVAQPGGPPHLHAVCVCSKLCMAGSQAVFVSVLKGDAPCHCFGTKDTQSWLNINAHVLKVLALPAR